jgi:hypothetical protein
MRSQGFSQFQLSFSLKPQQVPAPPVKSAGGSHVLPYAICDAEAVTLLCAAAL